MTKDLRNRRDVPKESPRPKSQTASQEIPARQEDAIPAALLETLLHHMPAGVLVAEVPSGRILLSNPSLEHILRTAVPLGVPVQETTAWTGFHPDGRPYEPADWPLARCVRDGQPVTDERIAILRSDGSCGMISVSTAPVRTADGRTIAAIAITHDVTDRDTSPEALRDRELRLRLAVELAELGTYDYYPQTGKLLWSHRAKRHFGLSPEAPVDYDTFLAGLHPDDRERMHQAIQQVMQRPAAEPSDDILSECRTIGIEDKQERWLLTRWRVFYDEQGRAARITGTTLDITGRKRAEQVDTQQRDFLEKLLNNAPIGIAVVEGPDLRYVLANSTYRAIAPDPQTSPIGRTVTEIFPQSRTNGCLAALQEVLRTGQAQRRQEFEDAYGPQQRPAWWTADYIPLRQDHGPVDAILMLTQDVTEQVQARRRIQEMAAVAEMNLSRLETVVNSIGEGILIADPQGNILAANPTALRVGGYTSGEQLQADLQRREALFEVYNNSDGHRLPPEEWPITRVLRGEAFNNWELRIHQKDTGQIWYGNFGGVPLRDRNGRLEMVVLTMHDITDRKHAEEALRASEERFRTSVESMLDGFGIFSSVRDEAGRIVDFRIEYVNDAACLLNRLPREQQVGKRVLELFPRVGGSGLLEECRRVVETGLPLVRESSQYDDLYAGDQPGRPVYDLRVTKLGDGFVAVWRDMTHRKRIEQQLQELNQTLEHRVTERTAVAEHRAAQLQRLAGELSRVEDHERRRLARILHDHLQQLLVGAKFSVSLLRGQVHEQTLRQSLSQVDELLNESITASRSLTVELSPPILSQGNLGAALHWLAHWMEEKHSLVTEIRVDEQANPQAEETRILLFQAVRELLLNVVKHAGVKRAIVEMHATDEGLVRIVIADTGVGFDPARIGRSHDPTSGFGLFNLQERLSLLGGRMNIESAPGAGTRITLLAPLQPAAALPIEEAIAPAAEPLGAAGHRMEVLRRRTGRGKMIRVLLADDHDVVRNGLARLLQTQPGIQVIGQASDGQMAVDLANHMQPDVVVMDVSMPRLDGVEATRRITAQLPRVKVIGLSMHGEGEVAERMRQAGAVNYLAKSSAPEDLIAAIRACKPEAVPSKQ